MRALGDADPERAKFMGGLAVRIGEVRPGTVDPRRMGATIPTRSRGMGVRAAIERIGGSYGRAMTAAQKALRAKPGHSLARNSLNRSMELLREQARALAPAEVDAPSPQAGDFFNLALRMLSAPRDPFDEKEPPTSAELADRVAHADRAMAALRRAVRRRLEGCGAAGDGTRPRPAPVAA